MNRAMMRSVLFLVVLCVGAEAQILCSRPLDIIVGVDVSGSTDSPVFSKIQTFLNSFADSFAISSNAAQIVVFGFDQQAQMSSVSLLDQPGAQSLDGVRDQIRNIPFTRGATFIQNSLIKAKDIFNTSSARQSVSRVLVLLTDGVNQGGNRSLIQPAEDLRTLFNARVISLGLPAQTLNQNVLEVLAGSPDQVAILTLTRSSCDDDDDDDDESDDSESDSDSSDDEGGSCSANPEVVRTVSMVCQV